VSEIMRNYFFVTSVLLICLLLTGCGQGIKNPLNWELEDFTFKNHDGNDLGLEDLIGDVWVADFIFTNCETVCPPMTANMTNLFKKLKEEGIENTKFVSFSVDPDVDTPDKIKEYMSRYELDQKNWYYLSGYSQKFIEDFALKNFKTIAKKPENDDQVIHGTSFYLINKEGIVVKDYSGFSDVPYDEIIKDIKLLSKQ
jgi:protein SCO1